jgi:hypothetical protein
VKQLPTQGKNRWRRGDREDVRLLATHDRYMSQACSGWQQYNSLGEKLGMGIGRKWVLIERFIRAERPPTIEPAWDNFEPEARTYSKTETKPLSSAFYSYFLPIPSNGISFSVNQFHPKHPYRTIFFPFHTSMPLSTSIHSRSSNLSSSNLINRRLQRLRIRAHNLLHLLSVLKDQKGWHSADAEFLRDIWDLVDIDLDEMDGREFVGESAVMKY